MEVFFTKVIFLVKDRRGGCPLHTPNWKMPVCILKASLPSDNAKKGYKTQSSS
jgi:hypothetical protein